MTTFSALKEAAVLGLFFFYFRFSILYTLSFLMDLSWTTPLLCPFLNVMGLVLTAKGIQPCVWPLNVQRGQPFCGGAGKQDSEKSGESRKLSQDMYYSPLLFCCYFQAYGIP